MDFESCTLVLCHCATHTRGVASKMLIMYTCGVQYILRSVMWDVDKVYVVGPWSWPFENDLMGNQPVGSGSQKLVAARNFKRLYDVYLILCLVWGPPTWAPQPFILKLIYLGATNFYFYFLKKFWGKCNHLFVP